MQSVSVVVATRNDAQRLGRALTSVQLQSYPAVQTIVVDDSSSDDTLAVLSRYSLAFPSIRSLSTPCQLGAAGARNLGIAAARGDLVAILDSDDVMLADRLARQAAFLASHPAVGVLGTWAIFDVAGSHVLWRGPTSDAAIRARLASGQNNALLNSSCMFRRQLIASAGGYRVSPYSPTWNEDYLTFASLAAVTTFGALPEALVLVDAGGLVSGQRLGAKIGELARHERHAFWEAPSWRRLTRLVVREGLIRLPPKALGWLYSLRLRRLPPAPGADGVARWLKAIDDTVRQVEGAPRG